MAKSKAETNPEFSGVDLFLREQRTKIFDLPRYVTSYEALIYFGLAVAIFTAFDSFGMSGLISLPVLVFVWSSAVVIQVAVYALLIMGWGYLQARWRLPRLYLPIATTLAFAANNLITVAHLGLYSAEARALMAAWPIFGRGLILSLIFELLFLSFVLPVVRRRLDAKEETRHITVAGTHYPVDELAYVRSKEHFVEIVTQGSKHEMRARLGDVIAQLDEADGVLAHRSHWVSRLAIDSVVVENGNEFILTKTGERLPIARTRREQVLAWINRHIEQTGAGPASGL